MRTLRTARLRLVPVTALNAGVLWEVLQEPDLRNYQDLPEVDRAEFLRVVGTRPQRLVRGTAGRFEWLLYLDERDAPVGWVSLRVSDSNRSIGEIGYSIVREQRGCGLATEAVGALLGEAFLRAALHRVRAYTLPENRSSRAVLLRNGFRDEGTLARGATVQGRPVDVIAHALERERWAALRPARPATRS